MTNQLRIGRETYQQYARAISRHMRYDELGADQQERLQALLAVAAKAAGVWLLTRFTATYRKGAAGQAS